jgi:hypothetical protein
VTPRNSEGTIRFGRLVSLSATREHCYQAWWQALCWVLQLLQRGPPRTFRRKCRIHNLVWEILKRLTRCERPWAGGSRMDKAVERICRSIPTCGHDHVACSWPLAVVCPATEAPRKNRELTTVLRGRDAGTVQVLSGPWWSFYSWATIMIFLHIQERNAGFAGATTGGPRILSIGTSCIMARISSGKGWARKWKNELVFGHTKYVYVDYFNNDACSWVVFLGPRKHLTYHQI